MMIVICITILTLLSWLFSLWLPWLLLFLFIFPLYCKGPVSPYIVDIQQRWLDALFCLDFPSLLFVLWLDDRMSYCVCFCTLVFVWGVWFLAEHSIYGCSEHARAREREVPSPPACCLSRGALLCRWTRFGILGWYDHGDGKMPVTQRGPGESGVGGWTRGAVSALAVDSPGYQLLSRVSCVCVPVEPCRPWETGLMGHRLTPEHRNFMNYRARGVLCWFGVVSLGKRSSVWVGPFGSINLWLLLLFSVIIVYEWTLFWSFWSLFGGLIEWTVVWWHKAITERWISSKQ